jgi:hypothetical protein
LQNALIRKITPDFQSTSEYHAAWIINLQTGRPASGISVVHHKPVNFGEVKFGQGQGH